MIRLVEDNFEVVEDMTRLASPNQLPFVKEAWINGQPAMIDCVDISGQVYTVSGGPLREVRLEDEWYADVHDPGAVLDYFRAHNMLKPDIFTFWQRLPDIVSAHAFYREDDHIAAVPITTYEEWFNNSIKSRVRTSLRKAEKDGLVVKRVPFDDAFVHGMTKLFNEEPLRQGMPFWHFGKDVDTVRRQFSRSLHRETMIAAYYRDEMVGFVMLGNAGSFGLTGQILSSIKHRDRSTNVALIAKAVEVCEQLGLKHLVYFHWTDNSLTEFKRRCGFEKTAVPRYYVPLTIKGQLALKIGAHRGLKGMVPQAMRPTVKRMREAWYSFRA